MLMMIRLTGACWAQRGPQASLGLQAQRIPQAPQLMVMLMLLLRRTGACWARRGLQAPLGLQAQRGPQAPLMMVLMVKMMMLMMMMLLMMMIWLIEIYEHVTSLHTATKILNL